MSEDHVIIVNGVTYYPSSSRDWSHLSDDPFYYEVDRRDAILSGTPFQFPYDYEHYNIEHRTRFHLIPGETYTAVMLFNPSDSSVSLRNNIVQQYDLEIYAAAEEFGIDPDALKAIIWRESGVHSRDNFTTSIGLSDTIQPTNIQMDYAPLIGLTPNDIRNSPENAIRLAAAMQAEISQRIPSDAPLSANFTLYQHLGADYASAYGIIGEAIYLHGSVV